jgi:hypothetical protein
MKTELGMANSMRSFQQKKKQKERRKNHDYIDLENIAKTCMQAY